MGASLHSNSLTHRVSTRKDRLRECVAARIVNDLAGSGAAEAASSIFLFVISAPPNRLEHITHLMFADLLPQANYHILEAIQYLSGDRVRLLKTHFEFIDEDVCEEVSPSQVSRACTTGTFYHPESGEAVEDFMDRIFMYFTPSSLARRIATVK